MTVFSIADPIYGIICYWTSTLNVQVAFLKIGIHSSEFNIYIYIVLCIQYMYLERKFVKKTFKILIYNLEMLQSVDTISVI